MNKKFFYILTFIYFFTSPVKSKIIYTPDFLEAKQDFKEHQEKQRHLAKTKEDLDSLFPTNKSLNSDLKSIGTDPNAIRIGKNSEGHSIFIDGLGREAYFRGYNVSGSVKLNWTGFKPFLNVGDARKSLNLLKTKTGANIIRFTIAWEGVNPEVDTIDKNYLTEITWQIKEAIKNDLYIILDYHQDLFSRYLFHKKSKHIGNGAPRYITDGFPYPKERCLFCTHWGMNNMLNKTITLAFKNFWNNIEIQTANGKRRVQDEFISQLSYVLQHLKNNLSEQEWSFILGLNPFNEPVRGDKSKLSGEAWNYQKLYPFYKKVSSVMHFFGWEDKILFAEPVVFWNSNAPFVNAFTPSYPGVQEEIKNLSFNTHYYDAVRMSIGISKVKNGAYLANMDHIRNQAAEIQSPPFISEFGMWIKNSRVKNQARMFNACYQAMDASKEVDSNYLEFKTPLLSGTQWQWDYYHNNHREVFKNKVLTKGDAWNGENFSIITDFGKKYTAPDKYSVERSYPRRCQGNLLHFYYNARPFDGRSEILNWGAIRTRETNHLTKDWFTFMAWKDVRSIAPTEIYLPSHFKENHSYLITESYSGPLENVPRIKVTPENEGLLLSLQNPSHGDHFALAFNSDFAYPKFYLKDLQAQIIERLQQHKSPVYLLGKVRIDKVHVGKGRIKFKEVKKQGRLLHTQEY